MTNGRKGDRRIGAGTAGHPISPIGGGCTTGSAVADVGKVIGDVCRSFACTVDWQHHSRVPSSRGDGSVKGIGTAYRLSEDHEGLHSGRYINVSVLRTASALAIKGGYYDGYRQPRTLYEESMPLGEVTAQALGCRLMEMHDRLCSVEWEQEA